MFQNKTPWVIALLLWMAGSTWWHTCQIKELCVENIRPAEAPAVIVSEIKNDTIAPTTEEKLAAAEQYQELFKPMNLYFNSGKTDYIHTPENEKFVTEAVKYLAKHPEKKLVLTGHTDNVGSDELNMKLSGKRANIAKSQMEQAGISPAQVLANAKGEIQPKESNETPDGRKANRRVEIVVQ